MVFVVTFNQPIISKMLKNEAGWVLVNAWLTNSSKTHYSLVIDETSKSYFIVMMISFILDDHKLQIKWTYISCCRLMQGINCLRSYLIQQTLRLRNWHFRSWNLRFLVFTITCKYAIKQNILIKLNKIL